MKPLSKGCATLLGMLWIGSHHVPQDGLKEAPTTVLCSIVNQLDTARRFMWNEVTRAKRPVGSNSINTIFGGIYMICAGIDVAKDKHDCCIISSDGEFLSDVFTVENTQPGFDLLLQRIKSVTPDLNKVKVGLEATGHFALR